MKIFLKFFIGLFLSIIFCFGALIVLIRPVLGLDSWDWQIILYLIVTLMILTGLWTILFKSVNNLIKILFIIVIILYIKLPNILSSVMFQFEESHCIEDGLCAEGTYIKRNDNKIFINEESCIQHGWSWNKNFRYCNLIK